MNTLTLINRQLRASGVRIVHGEDGYDVYPVGYDWSVSGTYSNINAALEAARTIIKIHREDVQS